MRSGNTARRNKTNATKIFLTAFFVVLTSGCWDLKMGELGQPCSVNGACLGNLVCESDICTTGGGISDGGIKDGGIGKDAGADGGTDGGGNQCYGLSDFTACSLPSPLYSYNICVSETCVMPGCGDATCNAPGPNFPLPPETGSHFLRDTAVTDEPVVVDTITGLVWQGCVAGIAGNNCENTSGISEKIWDQALAYCNSLDWGLHKDWRLPNWYELLTIIDYNKTNPATDSIAFPNTPSSGHLLSSSSFANPNLSDSVWTASFDNGSSSESYINVGYVRCVRGNGKVVGASRFEPSVLVSNQPTIYDNLTKLTWQGCPAGLSGDTCEKGYIFPKNWADAISYCNSLSWGDFASGWRLPNIRELTSLVDIRKAKPAIDTSVFPSTPSTTSCFWASTVTPPLKYAWYSDFSDGWLNYPYYVDSTCNVRCVRSNEQEQDGGTDAGLDGGIDSGSDSGSDGGVVTAG